MLEYKLTEAVEPKEGEPAMPLEDRLIEKTGHTLSFSMSGIAANLKQYQKNIIETKAMKEFEEAKLKNIEEHHEFVKYLSPMDLLTAYMYYEIQAKIKAATAVLEDNLKGQQELVDEVTDIKAHIPEVAGINVMPDPIPERVKPAEPTPVAGDEAKAVDLSPSEPVKTDEQTN